MYNWRDDAWTMGAASVAFLAAAAPPVREAGIAAALIGLAVVTVRGISLAVVAYLNLLAVHVRVEEAERAARVARAELERYQSRFGDIPGSDVHDTP